MQQNRLQVLVPGTNRFIGYEVETGKEIWSIRGLTWQMKPTPIVDGEVAYILGWAGGADQGSQENIPAFVDILKDHDVNKDGKLALSEAPLRYRKDLAESDFNQDGFYDRREWDKFIEKRSSVNSVMAVRLGGSGDMTAKNVLWRYYKSLPNATSPVLYGNVLYLMKEGGILTALDAATGSVLKQGRITGALEFFYSSPVAADGKIYAASESGHVAVIKAGPHLGDPRGERHGRRSLCDARAGRPALVYTNEKRLVLFWQLIADGARTAAHPSRPLAKGVIH